MPNKESERAVSSALESEGFEVAHIPEREEPTPDLLATINDEKYLIEVKTREDDPHLFPEWENRLSRGEIVSSGISYTNQNRVRNIIRHGVKQLSTHRTDDHDFSILWLLATGYDPRAQSEQFLATIFGTTYVKGPDRGGLTKCYYFHHSEFFRAQDDLDGAIVSTEFSGQLCINSYSPRAEDLKTSSLAKVFSPAIVDPLEDESKGFAYIADFEGNRNDEQATLRNLAEKYERTMLMKMDIGSFHAFAKLPTEAGDDRT